MENLDDAFQTFAELQFREFERRIHELKTENAMLRRAIFDMWKTEIVPALEPKRIKAVSAEEADRWRFYHAHKEDVATKLSHSLGINTDQLAWSCVKKETDTMWHMRHT